MRYAFLFLIVFCGYSFIFSQTPQIALVKPNGTTSMHSTFQSAYDAAEDDDKIFLPGGTFSIPEINKRIHIVGAGASADSCIVTGITYLIGCPVGPGASGGSIEGIRKNEGFDFYGEVSNYTIQNCKIKHWLRSQGICRFLIIKNNHIGFDFPVSLYNNIVNSIFFNNYFYGQISGCDSLTMFNNIFFTSNISLPQHSTYNNNIFKDGCSTSNSFFNNNANVTIQSENNNIYSDNINETWPDIFVNPGVEPFNYSEENDYRVKPTSQCHNSGTDGTDRGIYGGNFPWVEGMVPSNPHIFYKIFPGATNSSGHLPIHYKVRAQDN